jgi:phospholipid transport system substrate-binding protein
MLAAIPVAMAATEPLALVQQTADKMLTAIKAERSVIEKDKGRLYALVEEIVLPNFDFNRMAKMVLGKYWARASDDQRRRFVEEFRFLLVRTYATAMLEYTDQKIIYLPYRPQSDVTEALVQTEVEQDGGFPVPIDYKLFMDDDHWRVYEVAIDGVGLVINYRSSFATEIRGKEGLDGLIKKLSTRNDEARRE